MAEQQEHPTHATGTLETVVATLREREVSLRDDVESLEEENNLLADQLDGAYDLLDQIRKLAETEPDYAEVPNSVTGRAVWKAGQLDKIVDLLNAGKEETTEEKPATPPAMVELFDWDVT